MCALVWLCSRNDAIGNLLVLIAASGAWFSGSAIPDLVVAFILYPCYLRCKISKENCT